MGFYSFYKIIKDIIRTIFGRRFLKLFLIIIIFLICLGFFSSSFAASTIIIDDVEYELSDFASSFKNIVITRRIYYDSINFRYTQHFCIFLTNSSVFKIDRENGWAYGDGSTLSYYLIWSASTSLTPLADGLLADSSYYTTPGVNFDDDNLFYNGSCVGSLFDIFYSTIDILDYNTGDILFNRSSSSFVNPSFVTTEEELSNGSLEKLVVSSGELNSHGNESFYLFSYYFSDDVNDYDSLYPRKEILLDGTNNKYFVGANSDGYYIYEIPRADLGIDLIEGRNYGFKLAQKNDNGYVTDYYSSLNFTVGAVNQEDITNDKLDQQTEVIKENTETNKGIWETIKEILSYINPFSENFFAYKLVDLIIQGFQVLFDLVANLVTSISDFFSQFWSTDYDEEQATIDDSLSSSVDDSTYTNFITDLIDSINTAVTGDWSKVEQIEIPFGIVNSSITYKSDMISSYLPNSFILVINTFWMFLFGIYIYKFALNLVNWLKSGDILEGRKIW